MPPCSAMPVPCHYLHDYDMIKRRMYALYDAKERACLWRGIALLSPNFYACQRPSHSSSILLPHKVLRANAVMADQPAQVRLQTTQGNIDLELYWKHAPRTCKNFAQLASRGYYNGTPFHRM